MPNNIIDPKFEEKLKEVRQKIAQEILDATEGVSPSMAEELIARAQNVIKGEQGVTQAKTTFALVSLTFPRQFASISNLVIPEDMFVFDAIPVLSPLMLIKALKQRKQIKDPNSIDAQNVKSVYAITAEETDKNDGSTKTHPLNEPESTFMNDGAMYQAKISKIHYQILALMLYMQTFNDMMLKMSGQYQFIQYNAEIERLAKDYNIHDPGLCIKIEEMQLQALNAFLALIEQAKNYASSGVAAQSLAAKLAATPGNTQTLVRAKEPDISAAINAIAAYSSSTAVVTTRKINMAIDGNIMELTFSIDAPSGTYDQMAAILKALLNKAQFLINEFRTKANAVNYNIFTNSWGSKAYPEPNSAELNEVHATYQAVFGNAKEFKLLPPKILCESIFEIVSFPWKVGFAEHLFSVPLGPKETRKLFQKTVTGTKTERMNSKTTNTSNSQSTVDSFTKTLEDNTKTTNSLDTSAENYVDTSLNAGVEGNATVGPVTVSGHVDYTNDSGTSGSISTGETKAVDLLSKTCENHTQNQNSKVDMAINDSTKETAERTQEEGSEITMSNINVEVMQTIETFRLVQEYRQFIIWKEFRLVFSNGTYSESFTVSELDTLIAKYLKADHPQYERIVQYIKDTVTSACLVEDYVNRKINVLDRSQPVWRLKNGNSFFKLVRTSGAKIDGQDLLYEPMLDRINGVVKRIIPSAVPCGGTEARLTVSDATALGEVTLRNLMAEVNRKEAEAKAADAQVLKILEEVENMRGRNAVAKTGADYVSKLENPQDRSLAYMIFLSQSDAKMFDMKLAFDYLNGKSPFIPQVKL